MDFFFWLFGFIKEKERLITVETANFFFCSAQRFGGNITAA